MTTNSKIEKSLLNKLSFLANKHPFFKKVEKTTLLQIEETRTNIRSISENKIVIPTSVEPQVFDFKELRKRDLSVACPELLNKINF